MKKWIAAILTMSLLVAFSAGCGCAAEPAAVPLFLTPAVFVPRYNALMNTLADYESDTLGEEKVSVVKQNYTLSKVDPQGAMVYYGSSDWGIEASFLYAKPEQAQEDGAALCLNFAIKKGVPEFVAGLAKYALKMIVYYDFEDVISLDELTEWFDTADGQANVFQLPGYTLSMMPMEDYTLYAVLPPSGNNPYLNQ